jgi:acylphosphatase
MARLEATVFGLVQGVFFRQFTQQEANRLQLVGWVANRPDGAVAVVAEGDEAALRQLVERLRQGPPTARVDSVKTDWSAATGEFTDFRARYL